jgi:hypothetical protein
MVTVKREAVTDVFGLLKLNPDITFRAQTVLVIDVHRNNYNE